LTREAMRALASYSWPGNVRELRAEVLRWGVFCDEVVDVADLSPEIRAWSGGGDPGSPASGGAAGRGGAAAGATLEEIVRAAERAAIAAALEATGGNLSGTARSLQIDRNTLKRKLALYGLRAS
jgi:DNA-binding NtrC family response regulator